MCGLASDELEGILDNYYTLNRCNFEMVLNKNMYLISRKHHC